MRPANQDSPTLQGNLLHLFRQHMLMGASVLAMAGAMARIDMDRAKAEAAAFRRQVDQFIAANPRRAKELAAKVEAAKSRAVRAGASEIVVDVGDVL